MIKGGSQVVRCGTGQGFTCHLLPFATGLLEAQYSFCCRCQIVSGVDCLQSCKMTEGHQELEAQHKAMPITGFLLMAWA